MHVECDTLQMKQAQDDVTTLGLNESLWIMNNIRRPPESRLPWIKQGPTSGTLEGLCVARHNPLKIPAWKLRNQQLLSDIWKRLKKNEKSCNLAIKNKIGAGKDSWGGSVEASRRLVWECRRERERSTPLMSNEGDSEQVVELHSTEPAGVHISLFSDREN